MHRWINRTGGLAIACLMMGMQVIGQKIRNDTLMVADPRTAAFEKALGNARALKKIGAYGLARIEYDRAMRLNKKSTPDIIKEQEELLQEEHNAGRTYNEEVEAAPTPGSPQWRYDSVVALATRQFADKRFDSALANYKLAGQILPEQTFPGNQIRAIESELEQIWKGYVVTRIEQLNKEVRAALAEKKYADGLYGLYELMQYNPRDEEWASTQFANVRRLLTDQGRNTDSMLALVQLPDVWDVIRQKRPDVPPPVIPTPLKWEEPGSSRFRNVPEGTSKTKPGVAETMQAEAIPYTPARLAELFPGIDFTQLPPDQAFNIIDDQGEHLPAIQRAQKMKPSLHLSDSAGNIMVTCEGIYFNGLNAFLKIRINNTSVSDFPVGPMLLNWKHRSGRLVERIPVSISGHPVVQSGKYFSLIYVCRRVYMSDEEVLYFSLKERTGSRKWQIAIPGKVYNQEKNKRANQL